jgi:SAM-dependent methyltransferase
LTVTRRGRDDDVVPKNLSVSASAQAVEHFYAPIHRRMTTDEAETAVLRPTAAEFRDMLVTIASGGVALDAGCGGTASLTVALSDAGYSSVCGLDVSERNLLHARAIVRGRGNDHITFSRASVASLPFPNDTFDFVVCCGVVHHTPDPEQCVRELARVLKPTGCLYLSLYCFEGSLFEWTVRAMRRVGRLVDFNFMHRTFGSSRVVNNFLLDHMYVPLLWLFRARDVRVMLARCGLAPAHEFPSRMDPFARFGRIGQWISGDGLMRVWICEKRRTLAR